MEILRVLMVTIIGVLILMTLWPLFVFLVLVFLAYWVFISMRLRKMGDTIRQNTRETASPSPQDHDVIDVEYTERKD